LENRLKAMREARGWSQGELARRLGVSRQTINAVETDKYDPSLPLALRLAKLCDVAVTELFIDRWEPENVALIAIWRNVSELFGVSGSRRVR
jgi:putative transcriptional regulator